jgi:hypothetical protein
MSKHDQDFYGWTQDTVELLKQRRLAEVDVDALIEEVEDMGANVWNQLDSRMSVLLAHLLKWQYQPTHRGKSWQLTIRDQRYRIGRLLQKNPSLKPKLEETKEAMYPSAVLSAAKETDLEADQFPNECPWTVTQVLDDEFYPGA